MGTAHRRFQQLIPSGDFTYWWAIYGWCWSTKRIIYLTSDYNHALRHQPRRSDPWANIEKYLEDDDIEKLPPSQNLPDALLRLTSRKLGSCRHKNLLSDFLIQSLDEHITSMAGVKAAGERIQNTLCHLPKRYLFSVPPISTALFYLLASYPRRD